MQISKSKKKFGIGPVGMAISLVVFGLLWLLDYMFFQAEILHHPRLFRILGGGLIGVFVCWHIWAISNLRSVFYQNQLCTTGPYRLVRHPMYAGVLFLLFPGIALMLNSWILLLWPVLVYPVWSVLVPKEEKIMTEIFGEEYRSYAARTGRLFPGLF